MSSSTSLTISRRVLVSIPYSSSLAYPNRATIFCKTIVSIVEREATALHPLPKPSLKARKKPRRLAFLKYRRAKTSAACAPPTPSPPQREHVDKRANVQGQQQKDTEEPTDHQGVLFRICESQKRSFVKPMMLHTYER